MEHSRYRPVPGFKWKRIRGKRIHHILVRIAALIEIGGHRFGYNKGMLHIGMCLRKKFYTGPIILEWKVTLRGLSLNGKSVWHQYSKFGRDHSLDLAA